MIPEKATQLPKTAKIVWLIHDVIALLFLVVVEIIIYMLFLRGNFHQLAMMILIIMVLIAILPVIHMTLIPYFYRFRRYVIDDQAVYIYRGFIFRKSESIPLNRIQNVDTKQGPILRYFKLMDLSIETAAHGFQIEAIGEITAKKLRGQLVEAALHAREVASDD
ncbi:PH domain-containing protein [Leuconostoc falkenbergense]|uniref:PH domain-containing protein n=1 Tax=Leuconostoc falkenbergense TaxID=2766470 RepID=UPI0024AE2D70|nr:PH domain-containing protein [Leuconostoc falkenbergense]MDI6667174.1 PH domain-containing protein [Leuconostoc falkenbergense]